MNLLGDSARFIHVLFGTIGLAVFGSTRLFDIGLTGWVAIIPWVAPAAIGIPAIFIWTRQYRLKFGDTA